MPIPVDRHGVLCALPTSSFPVSLPRYDLLERLSYGWITNGRIEFFFLSFRVWLDNVERNILIFLGMPLIGCAIVKGAVCIKDMVNTVLKGRDKFVSAAFKDQVASGKAVFQPAEGLKRNAVGCQLILTGHMAPHEAAGRDVQRLLTIDNGMGHDDTISADGQSSPLSPEEAVKADKHLFSHIDVNKFGAMGGDVVPLEVGVDDKTIFLGICPSAKPGILQKGPLGHQHIVLDTGLRLYDCKTVQGSIRWHGNRGVDVHRCKNTFKRFSVAGDKVNKYALRLRARLKADISLQGSGLMAEQKVKVART